MIGSWLEPSNCGPLVFRDLGATVPSSPPKAVFLDRDGVLNEAVPDPDSGLPESPLAVEDVRLIPGAARAARELADTGHLLVCVSNQPGAAKGKVPVEQLLAVHERVLELLADDGARLDCSCLCLHHPDGSVPELSVACSCRKPGPGLLLRAAEILGLDCRASWMIGDTDADLQAGQAAGCRVLRIEYPRTTHKRSGRSSADVRAVDLADGVLQLFDLSV
jgi:D-glycero-D-manno-heptose 1,7-bisphosphate phosphatase